MVLPIILASLVAGGVYIATKKKPSKLPPGVPPKAPPKETKAEREKRVAVEEQKKKTADAIKWTGIAITAITVAIKVIEGIKADQDKRYGAWKAMRHMLSDEDWVYGEQKRRQRDKTDRVLAAATRARRSDKIGKWRTAMGKKYGTDAAAAEFRKRLLILGKMTKVDLAKEKNSATVQWIDENRKAVDAYIEASDKAKAQTEKALLEKARLVLLEKAREEAARPMAAPGQSLQLMEGEVPMLLPATGQKWVRGAIVATTKVNGSVFNMYRWKQVSTESSLSSLLPSGGRIFALEEE